MQKIEPQKKGLQTQSAVESREAEADRQTDRNRGPDWG